LPIASRMRGNVAILLFTFLQGAALLAQEAKLDSLREIIETNLEVSGTVKALNFISYEYVRSDIEKAKGYLWKAKNLGLKISDARNLSATYSQLTSIYQNQAVIDSARFYLKLLDDLSKQASGADAKIINANYYSTAGLYHKKSGDIKEALPYFKMAYKIASSNNDIISASGQAINIGNSYLGLSDYKEALNYYLIALKGFEQTKNKKGQSFCYQNIGECYIEMRQFGAGLEYIQKSIQIKNELNDKRGLGNAQQSLGRIYIGQEKYEEAGLHLNKALKLSKELKLSTEEVKIYLNLGKLFAVKNEPSQAIANFSKSKEIAIRLGDSSSIIAADLEILALGRNVQERDNIEKNAIENLELLKQSGAISKEVTGYKNMAAYYSETKQYDKALAYTIRYYELNDSIKNNELQSQFKQIEEQYNKVNNERQIELLQKDQLISEAKLKQQRFLLLMLGILIVSILIGIQLLLSRKKLKERVKEIELRNQLAADLHDEVGSSLSSIFMLSKMAVNTKDENQHAILSKVSENAHETMDKMSDIVWMLNPSENYSSGLKERLERFIHDLCHSRSIDYTLVADDLEEIKLTPAQSKNLYLVVKEGVNNAVKYSETKTLEVKITKLNKMVTMLINDEGIGFELKTVKKGNGLANMNNRANELKGNLKIDSTPKKGTRIRLSFPMS
jgi:signal transduction histidine kinase